MNDKLYIDKQKISLNSSQNVCQYIDCETGRLFTMIGEFHDESFSCGKNSVNISQYCKERLEKNSNCKVMLEYHSYMKSTPSGINSEPIRELSQLPNKYQKRICGWDTRWKHLNKNNLQGQDTLYYGSFKKLGKEKINQMFLKPCKDVLVNVDSKKYSSKALKILKEYKEKLKNKMNRVNINSNDLRYKLKDLWMQAADYEILKKMLINNNGINEIIVVAGRYHVDNLCPALSKVLQKVNTGNINREKKCVKVFVPTTISQLCKN